jgi:hypothetical protein
MLQKSITQNSKFKTFFDHPILPPAFLKIATLKIVKWDRLLRRIQPKIEKLKSRLGKEAQDLARVEKAQVGAF